LYVPAGTAPEEIQSEARHNQDCSLLALWKVTSGTNDGYENADGGFGFSVVIRPVADWA
jgi:hypothetical protein